jgi:hypothetical protein
MYGIWRRWEHILYMCLLFFGLGAPSLILDSLVSVAILRTLALGPRRSLHEIGHKIVLIAQLEMNFERSER